MSDVTSEIARLSAALAAQTARAQAAEAELAQARALPEIIQGVEFRDGLRHVQQAA